MSVVSVAEVTVHLLPSVPSALTSVTPTVLWRMYDRPHSSLFAEAFHTSGGSISVSDVRLSANQYWRLSSPTTACMVCTVIGLMLSSKSTSKESRASLSASVVSFTSL